LCSTRGPLRLDMPRTLDAIFLDLDGCLVDSTRAITNSFDHALRSAGISPRSPEVTRSFIGPPLGASLNRIVAKVHDLQATARMLALDWATATSSGCNAAMPMRTRSVILLSSCAMLFVSGCTQSKPPPSAPSAEASSNPPPRIKAWMDRLTVAHEYDPQTGFIVAREVVTLPPLIADAPPLDAAIAEAGAYRRASAEIEATQDPTRIVRAMNEAPGAR